MDNRAKATLNYQILMGLMGAMDREGNMTAKTARRLIAETLEYVSMEGWTPADAAAAVLESMEPGAVKTA